MSTSYLLISWLDIYTLSLAKSVKIHLKMAEPEFVCNKIPHGVYDRLQPCFFYISVLIVILFYFQASHTNTITHSKVR